MSGVEQAAEKCRGQRVGAEAADVAAFSDRAPNAGTFPVLEAPAGGIAAALRGARVVEPGGSDGRSNCSPKLTRQAPP
jgi:hypothetical protein